MHGLAEGMVLLHRKVHAGTGIDARRLAQGWRAVKPVIRDGIVMEIVEDESTDRVNRVGRLRYGLRPSDIEMRLLRPVCPDVHWLGPRGGQRLAELGGTKPIDLWSQLHPSSINHRPAYEGRPAETIGVGSDPHKALTSLTRGDREALAALLDGLHLVDVAGSVQSDAKRTERRIWKPMRPTSGEDGKPIGYDTGGRVARHTTNSNRNGFSGTTFAAISPLLVEAGYDPQDPSTGHAYRLAEQWIVAAREAVGWEPEDEGAGEARSDHPVPFTPPTGRQRAILSMLEGKHYVAEGDPPTHAEVGEAIAQHGGTAGDMAQLIATAMTRAVANAKGSGATGAKISPWWWKR